MEEISYRHAPTSKKRMHVLQAKLTCILVGLFGLAGQVRMRNKIKAIFLI